MESEYNLVFAGDRLNKNTCHRLQIPQKRRASLMNSVETFLLDGEAIVFCLFQSDFIMKGNLSKRQIIEAVVFSHDP